MPINIAEIPDLLKAKQGRETVQKALRHEQRIRLHAEVQIEQVDVEGANTFLEWVRGLIPEDKYLIFLSLFQFPAFTNELTGEIFNQLYRVFSGRNRAFNYQFRDNRLRDDWEWYRQEVLQEPEIWQGTGWKTMQTAINSLIIVDLPESPSPGYPQPYFYFLPIEAIQAYAMKDDNQIEWIAFQQDGDRIAFFDDQKRVIYQVSEKGEYDLIAMRPHKAGRCPARFFWSDELGGIEPQVKMSPISKQLSKLDWILFFEISKHHLDLYAAYPIYSGYQQDCDYSDPRIGAYCESGYLKGPEGYLFQGTHVARCPICSNKNLAGVGSYIEVPQPTEAGIDMRKPVDITGIDRDSLDYNVDETNRLKMDIFNNAVGRGTEKIGEAINEMQVMSGFETKTSVLLNLKKNYESAQLWVTETVCQERYGSAFIAASINYGSEFYVYTVKDLYEKYSQAKKDGASDIVLDSIQDKIIEIENMHNPVEMQRVYILKHLEPYRHLTKIEVTDLWEKGILTNLAEILLKIDFSSSIQRFERENTNIIEFGVEMEFDKKIETIKKTLLTYGNTKEVKRPGAQIPGGNPGAINAPGTINIPGEADSGKENFMAG